MPHEREPRLVAARPRNDEWCWLLTAVLTAFALLAALIYFEPPVARGATLTASERAEQQIAAFLLTKEEDVALVGSSLFHRLAPEYFLSHKVTNLALAGDSPLTGLAIVASASRPPPKLLVVEANVMDRFLNPSLVSKLSSIDSAAGGIAFFASNVRPVRLATALLYPSGVNATRRAQILAQPVASTDIGPSVAGIEAAWSKRQFRAAAERNIALALGYAEQIERRGGKVLFVFQPYAAALMKHPYATETIAMWQQQIASLPHRWLEVDVDADKLRFTDGAHLDERSAILYIEALERTLREQEVPRIPQSGR